MAKKYHIKWAAPAREDINEIIDYISQTNINYAIKILDKIEDHVKQLDLFPERYITSRLGEPIPLVINTLHFDPIL